MKKLIPIFILALLFGCSGGGTTTPSVVLELVSVTQQGNTSYGAPQSMVIVKNHSKKIVFNVGCNVQAIDASNNIIDTASAFPAGLGDINPGQSAQDLAVFFNLSSHSDYTSTNTTCTWLER